MRDDLAALMNAAVVGNLGIPITFIDAAGVEHTTTPAGDELRGVFDDRAIELPATEAGRTQSGPWVMVTLADLPEAPEPTVYLAEWPGFIINGTTYRISEIQRNGQGAARIFLKVAP